MERPLSRDAFGSFFDSTPSARPAYQAIRACTMVDSSQLIGRAATTMNHSDIPGLATACPWFVGSCLAMKTRVRDGVGYRIVLSRVLISTSADQLTGSAWPRRSR